MHLHLHVTPRRAVGPRGSWAARLTGWPERSQQRARHNAMVASTALTQARRERDEIDAYVAGALARRRRQETAPAAAPTGVAVTG